MVGSNQQDFGPKINILEGNHYIFWIQWITICQKVSKSEFSMSRITQIFVSINGNSLGAHFLLKWIFLKSCPIFDDFFLKFQNRNDINLRLIFSEIELLRPIQYCCLHGWFWNGRLWYIWAFPLISDSHHRDEPMKPGINGT